MYYITGDIHGEMKRFGDLLTRYGLGGGDTVLVAGDFGCVFGDGNDDRRLDVLAKMPYTILFIDGNHECFPKIFSYPEETWNGGRVHRLRANVLHLMRGQIFDLGGTSVFTMGGGISIDKAVRREGYNWWPQELPDDAEYAEAMRNLRLAGKKADVIVSHAAPASGMQLLIDKGYIQFRAPGEARLNAFLETVRRTVAHKMFWFGHLHVDARLAEDLITVWYDVYRLDTAEKVAPKDGLPAGPEKK